MHHSNKSALVEAAKKDEERENTFKPKLCKSKLAHMWASASRTELKGEKRCAHSHAYRNVSSSSRGDGGRVLVPVLATESHR